MQTAIIYGFLAALIGFVLMYLDTRLLDNPRTKADYLKGMAMVGSIVAGGIILIGETKFEQAIGIPDISKMQGAGLHHQYEESNHSDSIMTGEPNF